MKERSAIIEPSIEITEKAAEIAIPKKLAAMDALVYTTACMHEAELVTGDGDFKHCPNILLLSAEQ